MNKRDIQPVHLPQHLQRQIVKNMPIEEAYYLLPDDILMCEDTAELYLDRRTELADDTRHPQQVFGRVAVMRAMIIDEQSRAPIEGYVADLRYIENANDFEFAADAEAPDEQEARNEWMEDKLNQVPIAAIAIVHEQSRQPEVIGDQSFAAAVLYLAQLADERDALLASRAAKERRVKKAAKEEYQAVKDSYIKDADLPG